METCIEKSKENPAIVAGCCGCNFLWIFILILCGWRRVSPLQYGLVKNGVTGIVYLDEVHTGYTGIIGFWKSYIKIPRTLQSIEWLDSRPIHENVEDLRPINVRTADGLLVQVGLVLQYLIQEQKVTTVYRLFKDSYADYFISILRSRFQLAMSKFTAEELWTKRKKVKSSLMDACKEEAVKPETLDSMVSCWDVHILDLHMDQDIENKIEARQVEQQRQQLAIAERNASITRAITKAIVAEYDAKVMLTEANASAIAYRIKEKADTDAQFNTEKYWAFALHQTQGLLSVNGSRLSGANITKYYENSCYVEATTSNLVYGNFKKQVRIITLFEDKYQNIVRDVESIPVEAEKVPPPPPPPVDAAYRPHILTMILSFVVVQIAVGHFSLAAYF